MDDNAIYIDDVDMREYGFKVLAEHENPIMAPTRDITANVSGKNGAYYYGSTLDAIPFNFSCTINGNGMFDLQDKLRQLKDIFLNGQGKPKVVKLTFGYDPDRFYNVVYSGSMSTLRGNPNKSAFTIPLMAYDTNAYTLNTNRDVSWGSENIKFRNTLYEYGHTGDGGNHFVWDGETHLSVVGDSIKPIVNIKGSADSLNVEFGGYALTLDSFTNSDIMIDLQENVVFVNGEFNLDIISGDWLDMQLDKGVNIIKVTGTNFDVTVDFEYNDRFN